ncbi:MAG: gamma carbonic anhydrase family protein [Hellea sp.]|nr:gamma carbonic anhydrase family protein [Hellea sp.]MBT3592545.1 gamma carbonic anhydrase family protein [Hellea sp.]MBT4994924.1 gamma carbonic anhydrase family protein [Hellea sp.]MBT5837168.1 gamma carbonic anhydrase family protein [Hellea sp.]MBT7398386.1 gamma carbonic anhydrase family protein [Hellea sp.]MDA8888363.1 gamma carbonic anhydrase family protein [Hellea sp.]
MPIYSLDGVRPDIADNAYVAPSAQIIGNVKMADHSSVWFGAVIRGDNDLIEIGARTNIQDNSVLHTDPGIPLIIGDGVIVGHRVMLHGCKIGENTLIGIGATILNGAVIGKNCIIGAHSLITEGKVIPDGSMVVGSPGRIIKSLTEQHFQMLRINSEVYVANAKRFNQNLIEI